MKSINENIRAKYELVYHPTNPKQDGTFRKIRVELVDANDEGQPLRMQDEKHAAQVRHYCAGMGIARGRKWE